MEALRPSDVQHARARVQLVKGGPMLSCWVDGLEDSSIFLLSERNAGLVNGDKVLITIDGESAALMIGEIVATKIQDDEERFEVRLKSKPMATSTAVKRRQLTRGLHGMLSHLDSLEEVEVADLSQEGAAIICKRSFGENTLVSIDLLRDGNRIRVRGKVRHCEPKGETEFRCGIQFLSTMALDKETVLNFTKAA